MGCCRSKAYHVVEDNEQQPPIEPARQPEPQPVASVRGLSEVIPVRRLRALPPVPAPISPFQLVPAFSQDTPRESLRLSTFSAPSERNKLYSSRTGSPTRRSSLGSPSAGLRSRGAKLAKLFGPPGRVGSAQVAGSSQSNLPQSLEGLQQIGQSPAIPQLRVRRTSPEAKPYSPTAQYNLANRALARSSVYLDSMASPPPPSSSATASPGSKYSTPLSRQPWSSTSVSPESKGKQPSRTAQPK